MRDVFIKQLQNSAGYWDVIVIGGGASGLGAAVEAASRGYRTLLLEQHDFAKGTSSRSTKLIHGGVRYLKQGNISLVLEALHERGLLIDNAPHLVHHQSFIVPNYDWWDGPFYGVGLKGAFFGESMFSRVTDASKVALVHLVARLNAGGFHLLDAQFINPHLERMGAISVPKAEYQRMLEPLLDIDADFWAFTADDDPEAVLRAACSGQSAASPSPI